MTYHKTRTLHTTIEQYKCRETMREMAMDSNRIRA